MSRTPTPKDTVEKAVDFCSFAAVIFDLDGVLTRTARLHAMAWSKLFNAFLSSRRKAGKENCHPFSDDDYFRYVDGKPRREGIKAFLASRNIELPDSGPTGSPGAPTIATLAADKNKLFQHLLSDRGVEPEPGAVEFIERLQACGARLAVVSSSRNCVNVLGAAGLDSVFNIVVDGCVTGKLGLEGKPAPDVYLEAARRLGVTPGDAAVFEDALAGIAAARAGGFGYIVGIDHGVGAKRMRAHGADVVVASLTELVSSLAMETQTLPPSALDDFDTIARRIAHKSLAVFLDYDGTLTPIVSRPELAVLAADMREAVTVLSRLCPVAVISGRALSDVTRRVGVQSLIYAGSHGFDIAGPQESGLRKQVGKSFISAVAHAASTLQASLKSVPGVVVETKQFSVAVHYRLVAPADLPRVVQAVDDALASEPKLRKTDGKKVFELRPAMEWDKGRAMTWLQQAIGFDNSNCVSIYLGDDTTDEDAFRALGARGIGIVVSAEKRATRADYHLHDTDEVRIFLERLAVELDQRGDVRG
jgi:trehalose 6-phosphate phosphatase